MNREQEDDQAALESAMRHLSLMRRGHRATMEQIDLSLRAIAESEALLQRVAAQLERHNPNG